MDEQKTLYIRLGLQLVSMIALVVALFGMVKGNQLLITWGDYCGFPDQWGHHPRSISRHPQIESTHFGPCALWPVRGICGELVYRVKGE